MAPNRTQVGNGLAKVLGIDLKYRNETGDPAVDDKLTRGESVFSIDSTDGYNEEEPHVIDAIRHHIPTPRDVLHYFQSLFPFTQWILHYNLQWLIGDLVAGITIGAVVVPQGMAYATLANLPIQYGLYSSFMGVLIYWFFATSKDITIGPVAVMSTIVGNIVTYANGIDKNVEGHVVASALAVICGGFITVLGLLRLGRIVELISLPAVTAFITGSAISIAVGQLPTLFGNNKDAAGNNTFDTRAATYLVFINFFRWLDHANLNAAIGITSLAMLYIIRYIFNTLAKRQPQRQKLWFFFNTLRAVFVILLYTMISWLMNLRLQNHNYKLSRIQILGDVPRGFTVHQVPTINPQVINTFASQIPISIIVLLIEHISIAKSFGRINNYTVNPSQELVAIGVTNLLGPFLGAYPATGSFSRTAIKSKAGVRTPFAGVITAIVVLLAIYALPAVFFYIPNAALAAVIIHAVGDLITPPNVVYQFWRISPLEFLIFWGGIFATIFGSIEIGIYVTVASSFAIKFWRMFFVRGRFLGKLNVHSVVGGLNTSSGDVNKTGTATTVRPDNNPEKSVRSVFVPLGHTDGSNPDHVIEHPYPGVFIYRFAEGYTYTAAAAYLDDFVQTIFASTRRTDPATYGKKGDRPWNDPGPRNSKAVVETDTRPTLKAVILDFSTVDYSDLTSIQGLVDVRNQLDRYARPNSVQWHFANIHNRWTKRGLAAAGFGYPTPEPTDGFHRWKPVFSVAEIGGENSAAEAAERRENKDYLRRASHAQKDVETGLHDVDSSSDNSIERELTNSKAYGAHQSTSNAKVAPVQGLNRPFFHVDLTSALQSAVSNSQNFHGRADEVQFEHPETGYTPEKTV